MSIVLRRLNSGDKKAFIEGLELFSDMEMDWFSFLWEDGIPFETHLETLEERRLGVNIPAGRVPDSMLYAFLDGKIVGRLSVRHELNDHLRERGGHLGYAVATSYRKQGIGAEILRQGLEYCKNELGLSEVLITCGDDNTGSYKIIEKFNPRSMEKIFSENEWVRKYWISL